MTLVLTLVIACLAGVYSTAAAVWWVGRSASRLAGLLFLGNRE